MKASNNTKLLILLLTLLTAPMAACQVATDNTSQGQEATLQEPTLQSGYEIPEAHYPLATSADCYVRSTPGGRHGDFIIDHNPGGGIPYTKHFKGTKIAVGSGPHAPSVSYRSYIATNAGRVRYNVVAVCEQDPKDPCQAAFSQVDLRITNRLDKIQFYLINGGWAGAGPCAYCYQSVLVMDVALDAGPGDYGTGIIVFVDGKYLTSLPCVIHVLEPGYEIPVIAAPPAGWTLGPDDPVSVTAWEDLKSNAYSTSSYSNIIQVQSGSHTAYRTVEVYLRAPSYVSATMYIPGPLFSAESENATFKLLNIPTDICIMRILWNEPDYPWHDRPAFLIEIPPHTKPGIYQIEIIISLEGDYFGKLPLTVDVTE
jgi:hypothetical protein